MQNIKIARIICHLKVVMPRSGRVVPDHLPLSHSAIKASIHCKNGSLFLWSRHKNPLANLMRKHVISTVRVSWGKKTKQTNNQEILTALDPKWVLKREVRKSKWLCINRKLILCHCIGDRHYCNHTIKRLLTIPEVIMN